MNMTFTIAGIIIKHPAKSLNLPLFCKVRSVPFLLLQVQSFFFVISFGCKESSKGMRFSRTAVFAKRLIATETGSPRFSQRDENCFFNSESIRTVNAVWFIMIPLVYLIYIKIKEKSIKNALPTEKRHLHS